jgi:hypothetical protein
VLIVKKLFRFLRAKALNHSCIIQRIALYVSRCWGWQGVDGPLESESNCSRQNYSEGDSRGSVIFPASAEAATVWTEAR